MTRTKRRSVLALFAAGYLFVVLPDACEPDPPPTEPCPPPAPPQKVYADVTPINGAIVDGVGWIPVSFRTVS